MRKKIKSLLSCPDCRKENFSFYACELIRNNQSLFNIGNEEIKDEDDIRNGIVLCLSCLTAFPVEDFVGVFLSDADADRGVHRQMLERHSRQAPENFKKAVSDTIARIYSSSETDDGKWNREEMRYYDAEVDTEEQRSRMLANMKTKPVWRIFIPRQRWIINTIAPHCRNKQVLEIGGGVCRTVFKLFNPSAFHFNYIGTDISFKRLLVAKAAMPAADFIQCSALNLPFRQAAFDCILSFGMLHHLPRPEEALQHVHTRLAKGGFIGFHEPVVRPEFSPGITKLARRIFRQYQHSEHDGKINLKNCLQLLESNGHEVLVYREQISIVRAFTESLAGKFFKKLMNTKTAVQVLESSDRLFINTICRLSKKFGPNAVLIVTRKKE